MTVIKNGCICGNDYYTVTEQCDNIKCKSKRKTTSEWTVILHQKVRSFNTEDAANQHKCYCENCDQDPDNTYEVIEYVNE